MAEARWQRVQDLFHRASKLSADEWDDFVRRESGGQADVVRDVLRLLHADVEAGEFMRSGDAVRPLRESKLTLEKGQDFAGYRVLDELGAGGMGRVFLCEQSDPKRRVALKVLSRTLLEEEDYARFHAEGQMLALMDHPYIARIYKIGKTEAGKPYMAL